jgi:hypothetical protein
LLVPQSLIELLLLGFNQLARRVVGADEQVTDDGVLRIAQRRDRHNRRKPASIFADLGKLVDVFYPTRGFEDQRLEAWGNRGCELQA